MKLMPTHSLIDIRFEFNDLTTEKGLSKIVLRQKTASLSEVCELRQEATQIIR
jgi:hypothetical protein